MNEAQEILRKHTVEIDAGDHRSAEEIVRALGLTAGVSEVASDTSGLSATEEIKIRRPYFAN